MRVYSGVIQVPDHVKAAGQGHSVGRELASSEVRAGVLHTAGLGELHSLEVVLHTGDYLLGDCERVISDLVEGQGVHLLVDLHCGGIGGVQHLSVAVVCCGHSSWHTSSQLTLAGNHGVVSLALGLLGDLVRGGSPWLGPDGDGAQLVRSVNIDTDSEVIQHTGDNLRGGLDDGEGGGSHLVVHAKLRLDGTEGEHYS